MRITYAFLCDKASLSENGKLSVEGIFSRINAPKLPAIHKQSFLALEIELDYTEVGHLLELRVECVDADGTLVLRGRQPFRVEGKGVPGNNPRFGQFLQLPPMKFVRPGRHEINIFRGSEPGALEHVPFEVVVTSPTPRA